MVTFEELLLAKLINEYQLADVALLRGILREIDRESAKSGLIPTLDARGVHLAEGRVKEIQRRLRGYLVMLRDTMTARVVEKRGVLGAQTIKGLRRNQRDENRRIPFLEYLVEKGAVKTGIAEKLETEIEKTIGEHRRSLVEEYRRTDFAGVARPLSRGGKTGKRPAVAAGESPAMTMPQMTAVNLPTPTATPKASPIDTPEAYAPTTHLPAGLGAAVRAELDGMKNLETSAEMVAGSIPAPRKPSVIPDSYRMIRKLGEGGMGVVYLATDEDDRQVAVKVIGKAQDQPEAVERFKREILAKAFFDSENVVQIYDAGEFGDGSYFMAMEFVDGEELRHLIEREKGIPVARALAIADQIYEGIAAAHRARIIHRDLKPENILVTKRDGKDLAKVMDFGMARILDREELGSRIFVTKTGDLSGTPAYMAPEVLYGDPPTERSDGYALALILYELIAGKLPWDASTPSQFLIAHMKTPPRPLADVAPKGVEVSEELQQFFDKALAKKPKMRFRSSSGALAFLRKHVVPSIG